jgi:hypothetical protein
MLYMMTETCALRDDGDTRSARLCSASHIVL